MLLLAYRHGLRVSELVALRWEQVDLQGGVLHVRRRKNGLATTHPLYGPEIRALRALTRAHPDLPYVFVSEPKDRWPTRLCGRSLRVRVRPRIWAFRCIRTCCGTPRASSWKTRATTHGSCSII